MIQTLANHVAGFVVRNDETANYEILAYGLSLLISAAVSYTIVFASALVFGVIGEMLVAVALYLSMRLTIGGSHANSRIVCNVMYMGTLYLCIILSFVIIPNIYIVAALYIVNLILLFLYAPSDTIHQPIVSGRFARKILGIFLLSFFFALSLFILMYVEAQVSANLLILVPTLTCVLLHPFIYHIFGCEKSVERR